MENYTKYKLKSSDELASVLNGRDNLFVIACNKCFKEFETVDEPDCEEFLKFAAEQGKTVTGSAKFDFLCNKMHTERKLQDLLPEGTENVVVISCGLGIQTVADLAGKPVIAGGLITDKEDVTGALGAGAVAVSTTNPAVWAM